MNFEKAHKELLAGKKIRRKEWEPLMHLRMIDDDVVAFKGEYCSFYQTPNVLVSSGWRVVDNEERVMTFVEAIEELKNKKCITREGMGEAFVFVDKNQLATCKPVQFDFMPTWSCMNAIDWETMK